MKNFNSFEDFGNQRIDEAAGMAPRVAPFYESVSQMNAILESEDIAGKMEMMFIDNMAYAENLIWILKSKDRPKFYLKVTLIAEGKGMYDEIKYTVSRVEKIVATP